MRAFTGTRNLPWMSRFQNNGWNQSTEQWKNKREKEIRMWNLTYGPSANWTLSQAITKDLSVNKLSQHRVRGWSSEIKTPTRNTKSVADTGSPTLFHKFWTHRTQLWALCSVFWERFENQDRKLPWQQVEERWATGETTTVNNNCGVKKVGGDTILKKF